MASQAENKVDAALCARSGSAVERRFAASDLPRVLEAGAAPGSTVTVHFQFSEYEGRPVVAGGLSGAVVLSCQRCLGEVEVPLEDRFGVILVQEEAELAGEPGGYEPVLAQEPRLDLQWLAEEQILLALPLVAMHAPGECVASDEDGEGEHGEDEEHAAQRPFANLRDIMRKR